MATVTTETSSSINSGWKWGFKQIPKTTPEFAKWAARGVLYSLAILNFSLLTFSAIPEHIKGIVAQYSIEIAAFVHGIAHMFGVTVEGPTTITRATIEKEASNT